MSSVFSEQILADKLSKLNSTQQCIETLSHWCIFNRSKAELVVTTWEKQFHSAQMVQKVPLLYLANDILQNSKRKGNEFVTEFWKVLPRALKVINEEGDDHGKKVVSRLVGIWEERRVFGSRTKSLKELMLGEEVPPPLELSGKKRSRSVRVLKRDSRSIRTKLSIGGSAEKIVSAFHLVISENSIEDAEMSKCKSAVHQVRKLEKDVDNVCTTAKDPRRKSLAKELEEEESVLKQCFEKLKSVEASRVALVSQLREALHEQESELENVRTHMQVAEAQAEEASNMRKRLNDDNYIFNPSSADANSKGGQTPKKSAAAIAALVADKLTASSSSQLIMTSVLSTFAAEEAKNAGLTKPSTSSNSFPSTPKSSGTDSLSKPERSISASDPVIYMSTQLTAVLPNHAYQSAMVPQLQNHVPTSQPQFHMLQNPSSQQYIQPSGNVMPQYVYGNVPPLPLGLPPPPQHMVSHVLPLSQQPLQMSQQPSPITQQQQHIPLIQQPPSFRPLQPPGIVYYSHPHHSQ
ncbi:uncharacterized protein LOC126797635 [Argentina anserina]|uniref:uncharacterized protein LOC126797635 n=1 Tax=Argentina anserina TaxID=57926 RepID=UPI0021766CE1|nr:uncharacterized protein LOC126797635 [Potentilla anserina]